MDRLLLLALACLLTAVPSAAATANQGASTLNIGRLQEEIRGHEELLSQSGREERSLLDDLAALDARIDVQQTKIRDILARIRAQEEVLATREAR